MNTFNPATGELQVGYLPTCVLVTSSDSMGLRPEALELAVDLQRRGVTPVLVPFGRSGLALHGITKALHAEKTIPEFRVFDLVEYPAQAVGQLADLAPAIVLGIIRTSADANDDEGGW